MLKNYNKINDNIKYKISKLNEIKEIINKLFWSISNLILNLENDLIDDKIGNYKEYEDDIKDLINKVNIALDDFFNYNFFPPEINNFINTSNISIHIESPENSSFNKLSSYSKFNNESPKESELTNNKCPICLKNDAIYLCQSCNQFSCEGCMNNIHINEKNHIIKKLADQEKEISLFINSISIIFKNILVKCDYLLKKVINKKDCFIIKKISLPYINNDFSLDKEINFITNIEEQYKTLSNSNEVEKTPFHILGIESNLISMLQEILYDKQYVIIKNNLEKGNIDVSISEESGEFINE